MVLDKDFTFDKDYYDNFAKAKYCKEIVITHENRIYLDISNRKSDPYFVILCYPTTDVNSNTVGLCFKRDPELKVDKVIAFFKRDTIECIDDWGGTPGTREQGWRKQY